MGKRIWISWNKQRRNIGLAKAVGASLYMTDYNISRYLRMPLEFYNSWQLIRKERPAVCFTMNPSIFSSWWLSILSGIYNFTLVTDLHTPNIKVSGLKKLLFQYFFNTGIRHSHAVIVTNEIYGRKILELNKNVTCIIDPLPAIKSQQEKEEIKKEKGEKFQILLVSSFDPDELITDIMELDEQLGEFEILVTGNWRKMFDEMPRLKNIRFLGYVSDAEYDRLLHSVDGIMVLTKEEGCLCCGAYEAVSAGKPLILSRTEALEGLFGEAAVYADNCSASIFEALNKLKKDCKEQQEVVRQYQTLLNNKFESDISNLEIMLQSL